MKRLPVVVSACALAAAVLSATSQTPQQRPVFRAGTVFVSVDAYPRRDGKVVEGLTKDDFEIFEDGKPQAVEAFEFIRVDPITPDADRRDPTSVEDGNRQAADPHNRVFVVYLDIYNTSLVGARETRAPVIEFLTRAIGPTDLFAVMTPELPVTGLTFARRADTLDAELRKYWYWSEGPDRVAVMARSEYESRLLACGLDDGPELVGMYRQDLTARSVEQMIARLGALRDERKNILFISEGWRLSRGNPGTSRSKRPSIPTIGIGPNGKLGTGSNSNRSGYVDTAWCDSQYAMYAGIDYQFRFRELVNAATRANVAFYPIDVGGLRTTGLPASVGIPAGADPVQVAEAYRSTQVNRIEMLQDLGLATGGRTIANTNNLVAGVRKIADDLSAFYLLGYYSGNTAADGKFRKIDVKVRQKGIDVSARKGYLAPTEKMRQA
jgi:VWFA-related protein